MQKNVLSFAENSGRIEIYEKGGDYGTVSKNCPGANCNAATVTA